jgi:hypothetical protein
MSSGTAEGLSIVFAAAMAGTTTRVIMICRSAGNRLRKAKSSTPAYS